MAHHPGLFARSLHQLQIRILAREKWRIDTRWGTQNHCDPYWRLYVNKRRGAYLSIAGERYDIAPNRIHLIPAWVTLRCHSTTVTDHLFVHFDVIGLSRPLLRDILPRPVTLPGRAVYDHVIGSLMGPGSDDLQKEMYTNLAAHGLVCQALAVLCTQLPSDKLRRLTSAGIISARLAPALAAIETGLHLPLDNTDLAAAVHMSRGNFIRQFRQATHQTPARYRLERRIAAAAERLANTHDKIDDIAARFAFSNRFYFTRAFTRLMGVSPARYRKLQLFAVSRGAD